MEAVVLDALGLALRQGSCALGSGSQRDRLLELTDELHQVSPERSAHLPKLDQIEAPLAALVLGHERLVHAEQGREINLSKVLAQPKIPQLLAQALMLVGEDRFLHGDSPRQHQP